MADVSTKANAAGFAIDTSDGTWSRTERGPAPMSKIRGWLMLPSQMTELPELFQMARGAAAIENPDDRDSELRRIAEPYPSIAGVITLRDGG